MSETQVTIVILRSEVHSISTERYQTALQERLPEATVKRARTPQEEREYIQHADIATGLEITEELVHHAENLQLFACAAAGVDHLPMPALEDNGVVVTNASGIHVPNMAEHTIGFMLAFARRLHEGWRRQRNREWRHFQGFGELQGSTVTIAGLGPIGQGIAERLEPFGVETIGLRYTPSKGGPTDEVYGYDPDDVYAAFARTDYLVLICPLTETTEHLVDDEALRTLPTDAVIVNMARGGVIDTDALLRALRGNWIHGAALDVTDPEPLPEDHPLWNIEDVMITPHSAGHTDAYWDRLAAILARNVEQVAETGRWADLENQVEL